jgi:hypothetical protein
MKSVCTLFAIFFLLACGERRPNNDDGGDGVVAGCPCNFEYTTLPARVIKIVPVDNTHSDILLLAEGIADTLSYCNGRTPHKGCPVSNARLKSDSIRVGTVVRYIRGKRLNPDCTSCPIMEDNRIVLKKFEAGERGKLGR